MKEVFNLKDLIVNILRKWKWMLSLAIIFAVLLGGMKFTSGMKELKNPSTTAEDQKDFMQQKKDLESEIKLLQGNLDTWKTYYLSSPFMKVDTFNSQSFHLSFLVSLNNGVDNSGLLSNDIATSFADMFENESIYQNLDLNSDQLDLCSNLVFAKSEGSVVSVTAVLDKQGITQNVLEDIFEKIQNQEITVDAFAQDYAIQLTAKNVAPINVTESDSLAERQNNVVLLGDRYVSSLDVKSKMLETLESENGYVEVTKGSVMKSTIKFGIVGFVMGIVCGILLGFLLDLMGNKLRDKKELDKVFSLTCIGNPYMPFKKKKRNPIDRCIDRIEGKSYEPCTVEEKAEYIVKYIQLQLQNNNQKSILFTGSQCKENAMELVDVIQKKAQKLDIQIFYGENLTTNSEAVDKLSKSDIVIIMESIGISNWKDIELEIEFIHNFGKDVLGYILI